MNVTHNQATWEHMDPIISNDLWGKCGHDTLSGSLLMQKKKKKNFPVSL